MPRNGTGNYTLPAAVNPVVTQTLITSNWANTTMNDLAAAITQSLSKDGQTVPTAHLPMGGFRHTGVGDPALRNNYASLGYVQDGNHARLTGVAGVNQITGTLPGGSAALVNGQIVQLIPTANNTGAVTLNINGIGFKPIQTDIGNDLGAGNLVAGLPYLLSYNGAVWYIISAGGGVSGFTQSAISGWDRPTPNGPYPAIGIVNPSTVSIPAGKGRIVHPSARDSSGVTEVSWAAQNVVIGAVATQWVTVLGVNAAGAIVQFTGNFNAAWARDNILLGTVTHINGQINEVTLAPAIYGDMTYAAYDIAAILNNTLAFGGRVFPNAAAPLHVDLEAGAVFSLGSDSSDVNGPNVRNFPAAFDVAFFPITGASAVGASTQNVPVTQYDPGGAGVVTPIPGGASTTSIHRLYFLAGKAVFLYGQATYADLTTALSQIAVDDAATIFPSKLVNATLLCYIVAQKDCIDLKVASKARIVAKGGSNFSLGSAGSITDAPINGLTYGRKDATWVQAVPAPVGPQATNRLITYFTNTFARFSEGLNDTPETGLNSGSDWTMRSHADSGGFLNVVMEVNRATSKATFYGNLLASAGAEIAQASAATQALIVRQTGVATPAAGDMVGMQLRNNDITVNSKHGISFWGVDDFGNPEPGASIMMSKAASWSGGLDIAPTDLSFWTRPAGAGAAQVMRLQIASTGEVSVPTGAMTVVQNYNSSTLNVVLASSGNGGNCFLRPNGPASVVNQFVVQTSGNVVGAGSFTGLNVFAATSTQVILAATGAGNVFLRPNGAANVTGQTQIATSGDMTVNGGLSTLGANSGLIFQNRAGVARDYTLYANNNSIRIFVSGASTIFDLTEAGNLSVSGSLSAFTTFVAASGTCILAATGAGGIFLRPNGAASGTGQTTVDAAGNLVCSGAISSQQNFQSITAAAVLATTGAGSVYLRPNGAGSGVGEWRFSSDGTVVPGGPIQAAGGTLGFYGKAPVAKPTVTGAKGGNAALGSLIAAMVALGLITDTTTA